MVDALFALPVAIPGTSFASALNNRAEMLSSKKKNTFSFPHTHPHTHTHTPLLLFFFLWFCFLTKRKKIQSFCRQKNKRRVRVCVLFFVLFPSSLWGWWFFFLWGNKINFFWYPVGVKLLLLWKKEKKNNIREKLMFFQTK